MESNDLDNIAVLRKLTEILDDTEVTFTRSAVHCYTDLWHRRWLCSC
jgi:hypothetical protein